MNQLHHQHKNLMTMIVTNSNEQKKKKKKKIKKEEAQTQNKNICYLLFAHSVKQCHIEVSKQMKRGDAMQTHRNRCPLLLLPLYYDVAYTHNYTPTPSVANNYLNVHTFVTFLFFDVD